MMMNQRYYSFMFYSAFIEKRWQRSNLPREAHCGDSAVIQAENRGNTVWAPEKLMSCIYIDIYILYDRVRHLSHIHNYNIFSNLSKYSSNLWTHSDDIHSTCIDYFFIYCSIEIRESWNNNVMKHYMYMSIIQHVNQKCCTYARACSLQFSSQSTSDVMYMYICAINGVIVDIFSDGSWSKVGCWCLYIHAR